MIILKLFIAIIVVSYFTTPQSGNSFIETYYQLKDDSSEVFVENRFHSTRLEGLPSSKAATEIFHYLIKYRHKRLNGTNETIHHFNFHKTESNIHKEWASSPDHLNIAFVGDIMWIGKAKPNFVCDKVLAHLETFDVVIGNLETPIDRNRRVSNLLPDYLTYNSNPSLLEAFSKPNGDGNLFSVLSLANNHTLDRGEEGITNTMLFLDELGIGHAGVYPKNHNGEKYKVIEKKGISVGIYSATYGLNFYNESALQKIEVNRLNGLASYDSHAVCLNEITDILDAMTYEGVDVKIVYLHWSHEFELYPDVFLRMVARSIVQAGADVVIGSHPHVFQPFEIVYLNGYNPAENDEAENSQYALYLTDNHINPRKAIIYYSLGNFVSKMYTPSCRVGAIAPITFYRKPESSIVDWSIHDMEFVYNKVPLLPWGDHSLMLYTDYEKQYLKEYTKANRLVKKEIEFMMNHINSVN